MSDVPALARRATKRAAQAGLSLEWGVWRLGVLRGSGRAAVALLGTVARVGAASALEIGLLGGAGSAPDSLMFWCKLWSVEDRQMAIRIYRVIGGGFRSWRFEGYVVRVFDGDTVLCAMGDRRCVVRLYGVDAPERGQRGFDDAREALSGLVLGRSVSVECRTVDVFGRSVGIVMCGGVGNVSVAMASLGWVWVLGAYSWADGEIRAAVADSRAVGRGIWEWGGGLQPWRYRRLLRCKPAAFNDRDGR